MPGFVPRSTVPESLHVAELEACLPSPVKSLHTLRPLTANLLEGRTIHISLSDVPARNSPNLIRPSYS